MLNRLSLIKFRDTLVRQDYPEGKLFNLYKIESLCGLSKTDIDSMINRGVIQRPDECSEELLFTQRELIGVLNAALELINAACEVVAGMCGGCDE